MLQSWKKEEVMMGGIQPIASKWKNDACDDSFEVYDDDAGYP
jgi:hypothetical protein